MQDKQISPRRKVCWNCKFVRKIVYQHSELQCKLAFSEEGEAKTKTSLAVSQDYEGYQSSLEVDPEFGCIQFKKRKGPIVVLQEMYELGHKDK